MTAKPELLAPAGSREALVAAVRCGADAVYLGVGAFNARQNAANFTPEELFEVTAYCHERGVAVHLALNTLLREDEMAGALALAETAGKAGVDALIVQDPGLARRLRAAMPTMPLHASTQLSCHTPAGVDSLRDAGFSRVVLSREMSREEIAACIGRNCEIEVFVHGALCMSVSGQCYLSAMLGGRSGNRGLCAQPCRLPFSAENGQGEAALSLKDQSLIPHIPELMGMGVASLKIEGRMKRPEYVAAAVTACRTALDGQPPDPELLTDLQNVFSRSGFTDGYYTGHRGASMFGVRRKEDVEASAGALSRLTPLYRHERQSVPVTMELYMIPDRPVTLTVSDTAGHTTTVTGSVPEPVRTQPLSAEKAAGALAKTGGTPYFTAQSTCHIDSTVTLPLSALSALRRDALTQLSTHRVIPQVKPFADKTPAAITVTAPFSGRCVVRLSDPTQSTADLTAADTVVLPLSAAVPTTMPPDKLAVELPRGLFGKEEAARRELSRWRDAGVTLALCNNVGAVRLARECDMRALGGFGLNLCNTDAATALSHMGLCGAVLSFELTFAQMWPLCGGTLPAGLFVYGRQPLMLTRNCPRRCAAGSCDGCADGGLVDRKNVRFPTQCAGGCTELLNSVRLELAAHPEERPPVDFLYYHFTDETPAQVTEVLHRYARGAAPTEAGTRGLYRRGVL